MSEAGVHRRTVTLHWAEKQRHLVGDAVSAVGLGERGIRSEERRKRHRRWNYVSKGLKSTAWLQGAGVTWFGRRAGKQWIVSWNARHSQIVAGLQCQAGHLVGWEEKGAAGDLGQTGGVISTVPHELVSSVVCTEARLGRVTRQETLRVWEGEG